MADPDDLHALQQAALSVLDMHDGLSQHPNGTAAPTADAGDRTTMTEPRLEGFYWVILGQNPPEIAYRERGEWWLARDPKPWHPEAMTVASERLVLKPRLVPMA